ncbi:MAG: hypothetical protein ABH882_02825 [Candidatus Omnitrophota bacterium]|nr:hypothetical protein [Candidatus Omnitrophota bacterium]MBU1929769.1 hypothetical protein [Candidatus Omnitrophota bacterium]MBU2035229.1 hypothetical protein [Candidatus Omnitrophota bacterium]MBU2222267.1 hypothetical protein [Candidatus Omnitrophota bacterium]MBU2258392.1 hypothetical protein [Candidatus Omnitrophota bacterium]
MEKKEFLKLNNKDNAKPAVSGIGSGLDAGINQVKSGIAKFWDKSFGVIKFILGICLLVFVYSSTKAFLIEFETVDAVWRNYFWNGVTGFLIVYLFVFEPAKIYAKGHKVLEVIFRFFAPLVKVAPYVIPIYAIIAAILYSLAMDSSARVQNFLVFLFGFSLALHLVFSAKTLRGKKGDFLKGNYIFGFSLVFIINVSIAAFCLNLIFSKYSFVNFCNNTYLIAHGIFYVVFKQLFIPS